MTAALSPLLERQECVLRGADSGGDGVPVVFCHGAGADSEMFAPQVAAAVAAGVRTVTWDARGHGASRPAGQPITPKRAIDDLLALLDELGLDRPVLVGQSMGGNLAQAVVRRRPGLARGLVVIGSAWNAQRLTRGERLLLRLATPSLAAIPARRLPAIMADASAETAEGRAYARAVFASLSKREFLDAWRTTVGLLEPGSGARTPVPLLLIRGERDRTGTIATSMPRWAAAEGVDEHVIAGAGHIANLDAPDAVNALLLDFVASVS